MNLPLPSPSFYDRSPLVFLVGAGPGDPGLLTLRGAECLQQADVVVYDRLVSPALRRYAPQAVWLDVGKQPDHHPVPQEQINAMLIEQARAGKVVARLKGGDPFVFGRGGEEALALAEAGIPFEVVPGVSSAVAVPAYAGIPVTQRGVACSFVVLTGHRAEGDDAGCPDEDVLRAAASADTKVFLMGVKNLPLIVARLLASGCAADLPAAVIARGATPRQQVVVGTLKDIVERSRGLHPPAIVIVGEVVGLHDRLRWFAPAQRRPLLGLRVLNTRPTGSAARDEFSARLAALGADVLDLPVTRLSPPGDLAALDQAIRRLAQALAGRPAYDWLLFTSANAVEFFFNRLNGLGYDARCLAGARLGAVGAATAEALWLQQRLKADFIPNQATGAAWAAQAPDLAGKRVLLPRSEVAPADLPQALAGRGAAVEVVAAYTLVPADPDLMILADLLAGAVDVVTLFSPSAAGGLVKMLAGALDETAGGSPYPGDPHAQAVERLNHALIVCIGPTTAQAAAKLGLRVDLTPETYSLDGLVEALVQWRLPS